MRQGASEVEGKKEQHLFLGNATAYQTRKPLAGDAVEKNPKNQSHIERQNS